MVGSFQLLGCRGEWGGGGGKKGPTVSSEAPVRVQRVRVGPISRYARYNAVLEPYRQIEIFSRITGIINQILVEENQKVKEGALLAILDDSEQKLNLERAKAELDHNGAELQRVKALHQRGMISDEELRRSELAHQSALVAFNQAELLLSYTRITAPFAGVITRRMVEIGQKIDPTRPLFTLVDDSQLYLHIWVTEEEAKKIEDVREVEVVPMADTTIVAKAKLMRILQVVDPAYGKMKASFLLNPSHSRFLPGQFVEAKLELERHPNALLIPKRAIIYESGRSFVFVTRQGEANKLNVELGLSAGGEVEVLEGLSPQDSVVIEGQTTLRDRAKVRLI